MQAHITAAQVFAYNPIFELLPSSDVKPNNSWRNPDQRYDVKCLYCFGVHSDYLTNNNIAPSKRGTTKKLYNLLTCDNCGISYDDQKHQIFDRGDKSTPFKESTFSHLYFDDVDPDDYEYNTGDVVLKDHGIPAGWCGDLSQYNIQQPAPVKRQKVSNEHWKERVEKEKKSFEEYKEKWRRQKVEEAVHYALDDDTIDVWSLSNEEIKKHIHAALVKEKEERILRMLYPEKYEEDEKGGMYDWRPYGYEEE